MRFSDGLATLLGTTCLLAACNTLFGIDEPLRRPGGGGAAGTSSGTGAAAGSAAASRGGTSGSGAGGAAGTGGKASGGSAGNVARGGSGASNTSGTGGDGAGGSSGRGGGSGGSEPQGGTGNGGESGMAAGDAGHGGEPPMLHPCDEPTLRGPALIKLPAGTATIGDDELRYTDNTAIAAPEHQVSFEPFCIDRTEVSVSHYRECVTAGGCTATVPPAGGTASPCTADGAGLEEHPVTCITWEQADAYCRWAGKRLPTEKEWEYAARGVEGRVYPWGNETPSTSAADPASDRVNWNNLVGATTQVDAYPNGATPEGVLNLSGNVWEWTASVWCTYPRSDCTEEPVARGGSFASANDDYISGAWRDPDSDWDGRFGFRCALGAGEGSAVP